MIIADTNVLSELMRSKPHEAVLKWVDYVPRIELGITSISVAEILYGIGVLPDGKKKKLLFKAATGMFEEDFKGRIYSFDRHAAVEYADIVIKHEKAGSPISMADAQIAAICLSSNYKLATRNIKDFNNTGVDLINPWET